MCYSKKVLIQEVNTSLHKEDKEQSEHTAIKKAHPISLLNGGCVLREFALNSGHIDMHPGDHEQPPAQQNRTKVGGIVTITSLITLDFFQANGTTPG